MKVLFVHVAANAKNKFMCSLIPGGMMGEADALSRKGHEVVVIHRELEEMLDEEFSWDDLKKVIEEYRFLGTNRNDNKT